MAAVLVLFLGQVASAQGGMFDSGDIQVHGFLSQGIVLTSDNNFLGSSDNGSLDFREIGINASWRPNPDLQISAQVLSHRTGEFDEGHPRLDYAMLDWTVLSGESGRAGLRAGRVKNNYGLYNSTRDVAITRPSILLPQSIYPELTRNLQLSLDGATAYVERYTSTGNLYLRYQAGYLLVKEKSSEVALLGRNSLGKLDSNLFQLLNLTYEGNEGHYVLGVTSGWGSIDYEPGPADFLGAGRAYFHPIIVSAQYNWEKWSVTAEHLYQYTQIVGFGIFPDSSSVQQSYYLQGAYRPSPRWETFLRYDAAYANRDDRDGKKFAADSGLPAYLAYAKDWTIGVRYDVTPRFMVRAEYHNVEGVAWLSPLENPNLPDAEKYWDMFMLLGVFHF